MAFPTAKYRPLFEKYGKTYRFDPRLLEAQALVESSGHAEAFRYEIALHDASFGLMQVLGRTARKLGLPENECEASLCDPAIGILYGVKALVDICAWVGSSTDMERASGAYAHVSVPLPKNLRTVLARYNGGGKNNPDESGLLRNEDYVLRIEAHFEGVVKDIG